MNAWQAESSTFIAPLVVKLLKIEGAFAGHYVSLHIGKNELSFSITHCTHTGHFTGTASISTSSGTLHATLAGVVHANKHVGISFSGSNFGGTFVGIASHTGGSISGTYSVVLNGTADSGSFKVAKA